MKALLEISFKPYAMTDDKSQGRQDQEKIVRDDFRTQFSSFEQAVKDELKKRSLTFARDCAKEGCLYSTDDKYISDEQGDKCPVQHEAKCACEGIRVLINYIGGMTDRHANLEYSRLYLPPEISRI